VRCGPQASLPLTQSPYRQALVILTFMDNFDSLFRRSMHTRDGYASLKDEELVQRIVDGDQAAFLQVYDRLADQVYGLAMKMLGRKMKAEDVTQEAFLKLWEKAHTFNAERGSVSTWLLTITRYTALDRIRSEDRVPDRGGHDFDPEETFPFAAHAAAGDLAARKDSLRFAVQDLPPEQARVIELAYFQGMTHSQIAEYEDIPLGTVKTRIRLGMDKLRNAWNVGDSRP